MYYDKHVVPHGLYRGSVYVNDFSRGITGEYDKNLIPLNVAKMAFNADCSDGAIKDGCGIKISNVFSTSKIPLICTDTFKAKKLYYYKRYDEEVGLYVDYLMFYADDGNIYECRLLVDGKFYPVKDLAFESAPTAVNYTYNGKDVIIFSCKNVMKLYDGKSVSVINNAPVITSMCIHSERLFATEGNEKTSLWFSDDFNPMNWNISLEDAGFIDLRDGRGSLLKVLSFGGYVYAFRNYGITRITAYGDQMGFSVDGVSASSGKIFGDSITICGDRVIYLAKDGFYAFSGGVPVRILKDIDSYIENVDNSTAKGCYYNGVFYCTLNMKCDGKEEKVMLIYNVHTGDFSLMRGPEIVDFVLLDGENKFKLLFICKDKSYLGELCSDGENYGAPLEKIWKSGDCDFSKPFEKLVSKITLLTKTPVELTVKSERDEKILHFGGSENFQTLPVGIKGDIFNFEIFCDCPLMKVSKMKIDFEYFREKI